MILLKKTLTKAQKKKNKESAFLLHIFTLITLTVFLSSCGIPSIKLFEGAILSSDGGAGIIKLTHNTGNDSVPSAQFLGYEIYYKLYLTTETDLISSDLDYITDTDRVPSPTVLTTKNFLRIKLVNYDTNSQNFNDITNTPNLEIEAGAQSILLDFGRSELEDEIYRSGNNETYGYQALLIQGGNYSILHRNFDTDSSSFFIAQSGDNFNDEIYDIKKMISNFASDENLEIVIAVLPYGIDLSTVKVIYGTINVSNSIPLEYTARP